MGKRLIICEKPSVARDIAAALGGFTPGDGDFLESEDYVVTWAVGHLLELAEPQDYDKALRSWSIKHLPIIPQDFKVKPRDGQKKRLDLIKRLGKRKDVDGLINACDAGREGEAIYRRIVEFNGLDGKPQQRLWLQSMTPAAIRAAFDDLRPGADLDNLGHAAYLRGIGDWLIGMNATRALTQRLKSRGESSSWSAGRVQTPTLWLLVQREREILAHVPRPYWEIAAAFECSDPLRTWEGRFVDESLNDPEDRDQRSSRVFDKARVDGIVAHAQPPRRGVASEKRKKARQAPPLPFDLTSLQREANRRFSMSAKRTLDAAQRLYEGYKLLTYPRTDSRHLPDDYEPTVRGLLDAFAACPHPDYAKLAAQIVGDQPQNLDKVLDSSKVSDHFAITPTGNWPEGELTGDDARVFDLAVRQFLASLMGPAVYAQVERIVEVDVGEAQPGRFRTTARSLEVAGFQAALGQEEGSGTHLPPLVPGSDEASGVPVTVTSVEAHGKNTVPPPRYTEAQLLRMMETAGERVDDEDYSYAMKGRGLGTPATRADTIERLVATAYARRVEGKLGPTSKAMRLMDVLERVDAFGLASPKLTGEWEHSLDQVEKGELTRAHVEKQLVDYTRDVVSTLVGFDHETLFEGVEPLGTCPECGGRVLESAWGYPCENNTGADSSCTFILWKDKAGRFIDRKLARELVANLAAGPVEGFVDRAGRRFSTGSLALNKDPETGRWALEVAFGAGEREEGEERQLGVLWPCPEHEGCEIVETDKRYVCRRVLEGQTRKGPVLPRVVCHREMTESEVEAYFGSAARTEIFEGFVSRRGRPFRGLLFRKSTGKHGFEFPPREPKKGAEGGAAEGAEGADVAEAPAKRPARKGAAPAAAKKGSAKAKKPAAKKATGKKAAGGAAAGEETAAPKSGARKPAARKPAARKPAARKPAARKPAARKKSGAAEPDEGVEPTPHAD